MKQTQAALILTGGGARAAYQAGVLKAIAEIYPRNHAIPFPVVFGSSAGAINGTALACYASCFRLGVKKLEWVWKNFSPDKVYYTHPKHVLHQWWKNIFSGFAAEYANPSPVACLNNAPLRQLLSQVVDLARLERNIGLGHLSALAISASCYSTGQNEIFFQGQYQHQNWHRAHRRGRHTKIQLDHLMASAAIPFVFPSVQLHGHHYGDGSVHQLAPLSPAIHLGASRLLVISTSERVPRHPLFRHKPPSAAEIAGHLLDGIFADGLTADLERLHRVNQTLAELPEQAKTQQTLKNIQTLVIRPSIDFSQLAEQFYGDLKWSLRRSLALVGISDKSRSSLLSYILFESGYCKALIQQGYLDGRSLQTQIQQFLS